MTFVKIIQEAIAQALQQLRANKLRSFLSLLGISIGIFCIIGVLSAVDSLEDNVRGSLQKLGDDVIYVNKWPWADVSNNWWDIMKWPQPNHKDYEMVKKRVKNAELVSYHVFIGMKTLKWNNRSVKNSALVGHEMSMADMFSLEMAKGRYVTQPEYNSASNVMVIGDKIASELFGAINPIGKKVKMMGRKYEVIGVIEKAGDDLLNVMNFDEVVMVNYNNALKLANLRSNRHDGVLSIKAPSASMMEQVEYEVEAAVRAARQLKPKADNNFSINKLTMISNALSGIFTVLNGLGVIIGIFAMLVGVVSVANIMFVSVKERTNIIGVKMALGAKSYFILLEFLIEAVVLCLLGGLIGLGLVWLVTTILTSIIDFKLYIDFGNLLLGVGVSIVVGVLSGIIPAIRASQMDPVEAMRQ